MLVVGVAQLAEHRVVAPVVEGSIPFTHPIFQETFEERPILLKFKEGDSFNHRDTLKYFEGGNLSLTKTR